MRPSTPTVDALEAGLLALQLVDDLGREAVPFGPAQVHPQQHLGPVGRLGAAGARADRQQRVRVRRTRRRTAGRSARARSRLEQAVVLARPRSASKLGVADSGQLGELEEVVGPAPRGRATSRSRSRRPSASRRTVWAARWSSQKSGRAVSCVELGEASASLAPRSKTPRGRPDRGRPGRGWRRRPPSSRRLQVLEQDRAQLDDAQRGLAPGDDGVHAGTVAVVGADAAVAVAVERRGVTARTGSHARRRSDRRTTSSSACFTRSLAPSGHRPGLGNDCTSTECRATCADRRFGTYGLGRSGSSPCGKYTGRAPSPTRRVSGQERSRSTG